MNHRDLLRQVLPWLRGKRINMACDRITSHGKPDLPITPGEELLLKVIAEVEQAIGSGGGSAKAAGSEVRPTLPPPGATINAGVLGETFDDYRKPNWDGYGAEPVREASIRVAAELVAALPSWLPTPEVAVDPDGDVTLDWLDDKFSVSVCGDMRRVAFAGRGSFVLPTINAGTADEAKP